MCHRAGITNPPCKDADDTALLGEAADMLYHLMVLLQARDLTLDDVVGVLQSRHRGG